MSKIYQIRMLNEQKFIKLYIKSNSDGGFPAGFNSVEVGRDLKC